MPAPTPQPPPAVLGAPQAAPERRSLWGRKKEAGNSSAAVDDSATTEHWQAAAAALGDDGQQNKFLKLMGAKPAAPSVANQFRAADARQRYEALSQGLEQTYNTGLMMGGRRGLGQ